MIDSFRQLNVFVDSNGLLRCGPANIPYDLQKHYFTKLVVIYAHAVVLHNAI